MQIVLSRRQKLVEKKCIYFYISIHTRATMSIDIIPKFFDHCDLLIIIVIANIQYVPIFINSPSRQVFLFFLYFYFLSFL